EHVVDRPSHRATLTPSNAARAIPARAPRGGTSARHRCFLDERLHGPTGRGFADGAAHARVVVTGEASDAGQIARRAVAGAHEDGERAHGAGVVDEGPAG